MPDYPLLWGLHFFRWHRHAHRARGSRRFERSAWCRLALAARHPHVTTNAMLPHKHIFSYVLGILQ